MISILAFIVSFGLLVLVHEFGHFWVARRSGIKVEKFSIGFGPKIFGFHSKGTEFCVSLLPLGGFVKMRGEQEEEGMDPNDQTSFSNKKPLIKSAVVLAGPMMNLVLSFILMPIVFMIGKPEPGFLKEPVKVERVLPNSPADKSGIRVGDAVVGFNKEPVQTWDELLKKIALSSANQKVSISIQREGQEADIWMQVTALPKGEGNYLGFEKFFGNPPPPVVAGLIPDGAAEKAGLRTGDVVEQINAMPVQTWDDIVRHTQNHKSGALTLYFDRAGEKKSAEVMPSWEPGEQRWMLGIKAQETATAFVTLLRRYPLPQAIVEGFKANWKNITLTFEVLGKLVTREISYKNLGGPVRIAYTLAKSSAAGFSEFLYFTAYLSLQLAILNLLPIPVLDGGHILFYLVEGIRRKPLSIKTKLVAQQVGLLLLLTLFLFVTWNDINQLLPQWFSR